MLCDSLNRRILILAGQRSDQYLSDLWSYSIEDGRIECLDRDYGHHGGPDGGFTQRAVMDAGRREFILLSGLMKEKAPPHFTQVKVAAAITTQTICSYLTESIVQNTIWLYSLETGLWQKIDSTLQSHLSDQAEDPKPRFAHQFVYDRDQDDYYVSH